LARDGNGNYSNPYPDFVSGTVISSTEVDANNSAIATALTQSIAVDGQSVVTADLPMAGNKHTVVDAASGKTVRAEYASAAVVQDGDLTELVSVGGTADVITAGTVPAITAYAAGQRFAFVVGGTNTTGVTINVSSVGAKAIQKLGAALVAGDLTAGDVALIQYDGTQFQLLSPARTAVLTDGSIATAAIADNAINETKLKDALIGDFTEAVVVAGDTILFGDADDSGNTKRDTVQGILDLAGGLSAASQAEMEAASSTTVAVTPGRTQYHPGVAKGWAVFSAAGVLDSGSYNVSSITDTAAGRWSVNWDTDFADTNYTVQMTFENNAALSRLFPYVATRAVGSAAVETRDINANGGDETGLVKIHVIAWGDQ